MPEKKNNIITFRTTEETREKLEEYANLNKWSISKAIEERKVKTMAELLRYCIENNLYETFMRGNEIYTTILKESSIEN